MPGIVKILIVDDDHKMCDSLKALLSSHENELETSNSAREAIGYLKRELFDVVLLDIWMPDANGYEVMDYLTSQNLDTSVIVMTGQATTESAVEALRKGAYDYLRKPFGSQELLTTLKNALDHRRLKVENRQASKALRESEEKYRLLVENVNDSIFIIQDGSIRFANERTEEMTGYSVGELEEIPFVNLVHSDDRNMVSERLRRGPAGKELPSTYTYRTIGKAGKVIWNQVSAVPVTWRGNPAILNSARDITQQKILENQLVTAQRMEALGAMAGGIAHDFNNLLMAVMGNASLLLMEKDSGDPDYAKLENIQQYAQKGADLTKQLLGFAKGRKSVLKTTDTNDIMEKSSEMFGRTKKEIQIHGRYQEGIWSVAADRGQLEQVLLNIYVNADQAMPDGGHLYLETNNVILDQYATRPFALEPGHYIKISITDTGIGMDEATQKRIFEPFFTTKETAGGTGLGLASSYGIIKDHGGAIGAYSEKGKGTTFSIYLPASGQHVVEEEERSSDTLSSTETVLLVDDEEMIIDVGRELLVKLGFTVITARNGKRAIQVYSKNEDGIDIVILDMIMSGMGGGETYDRLKQMNPDIKVLLASGYGMNGLAMGILDRGCDGFIQKPFNMRDLSRELRGILDR